MRAPVLLWIRSLLLSGALLSGGCGNKEASGPLPDPQRAGHIALETGSARAFRKLYPDALPETGYDECENRIGHGERCGETKHLDVTLTHRPQTGDPVDLLIEIGPRGKVLGIQPRPGLLSNPVACDDDDDCTCARCTGCVNRVNLPAKLASEADGCEENRCATAGCRCAGGTCRTR